MTKQTDGGDDAATWRDAGRLKISRQAVRLMAVTSTRLGRWPRRKSWRGPSLAFVCGVASILSMAPFAAWPVLWVTLPALCLLADQAAGRVAGTHRFAPWRRHAAGRAAETGWWFGLGYHLAGLFWIGEAFLVEAELFAWLMPFAVVALPAALAFFTAAATGAMHLRAQWSPPQRAIVLAIALGLAEWLRGHVLTGFPWNVLGYALTAPDVLMQSASVFGIYGLTVIAVVVFAGPAALLRSGRASVWSGLPRRTVMAAGALAAVPLLTMAAAGTWRLATATGAVPVSTSVTLPRPRVRLVQTSIPQRERMQPENQRRIFDRHLALSMTAPDGSIDDAAGIALLIWPEAAMPFVPLAQPTALADIGQLLQSPSEGGGRDASNPLLLSGALRVDPALAGAARKVYNSALLFGGGAAARLLAVYDKTHLVPFGEYLPAQPLLEALGLQQVTRQRGGLTPGSAGQSPMLVPGIGRVLVLICYEAIFPLPPLGTANRPDLLVVLTNDSWFGDTTGPRQHYLQARVRAVEMGLPMVRASTNGISAFIDGYGRTLGQLDLDVVGTLDGKIPMALAPTLYARFGDDVFFIMIFGLLLALWALPVTPSVTRDTA